MKVILLKDVRSVGRKGEAREVADGYAKNYLLPRHLAEPATPGRIQEAEALIQHRHEQEQLGLKDTQALAKKLEGLELEFKVKASPAGKLYAALDENHLREALARKGFDISKTHLSIKEPLKEIGVHSVKLVLPHHLEAEIKVELVQEA